MGEIAELARAWFAYLGDMVLEQGLFLWRRLCEDGAFRAGFLQACGITLVVGYLSSRLLFWSGKVRAFYQPVAVVSFGPKPSDVWRGCTVAGVKLAIIVLVLLCLLMAVLTSGLGGS